MSEISSEVPPLPGPTKDERTWATFCHLAAFAGLVVPFCGNVIGPLVLWLIKREESAYINTQGKEALNFQITMLIGFVIAFLLMFVLVGIVLMPALVVIDIILVIIASIKANNGEDYRYPLTLRLIK